MRQTACAIGLATAGVVAGMGGVQPVSAASPVGSQLAVAASRINGQAIVAAALKYLGVPYVRHGNDPATGFDDVGFVQYVFATQGVKLPSRLALMRRQGTRVKRADLQPGDLLFFKNTIRLGLSHVGIYEGDGKVVHAEWYGTGVTVTSLVNDPRDGNYWFTHYKTAIRL